MALVVSLSRFPNFVDFSIKNLEIKKSVKIKSYTQKKKVELSLFQKHNDQIRSIKSTSQTSLIRSNETLKPSSNQLQLTKRCCTSN